MQNLSDDMPGPLKADQEAPSSEPTPLKYKINPCDYERYKFLAPIGDFVAWFGSDCKCCSGARVLGAAIIGFVLGALIL